jgi:hypothetical protein
LPGETVFDTARTQKFQSGDHAIRESLALIRSILIDSGPSTAPRARFFVKYFCAVHEANSNVKNSARSRFSRSVFSERDVREEKPDGQKDLILSHYL